MLDRRILSSNKKAADYLTFTATSSGTFSFTKVGLSYSTDGSTWTTLAVSTPTPTIAAGSKIYFKGTITPSSSAPFGIGTFSSTGNFTVSGTPMSLLFGDDFDEKTSIGGKDYAFYQLFSKCTKLTSIDDLLLPATTLASDCYTRMFYGCTGLTSIPSDLLPATTLKDSCYRNMFYGCSNITTAPNLKATTLTNYCYYYMFNGCTKLSSIRMLATDISATNCLYYWVKNVALSGTFYKKSGITMSTGISGVPSGWTIVNE